MPVFFHTGSALGIRPSELSPPERFPAVLPTEQTRIPFRSSVLPPPKQWAGPTSRGSRAFSRPRVPGQRSGISEPPAGCSLELRPSRVLAKALIRLSPDLLSRASHVQRLLAKHADAPESRSTLASAHPNTAPKRDFGQANPFRVFAPARSWHSNPRSPWLCVHLSLRRALPPTDQRSSNDSPSYLSCQDRLRC